jgi:hypothetical protein
VKDGRIEDAIRRAKRIMDLHKEEIPSRAESSTTVYLLVEALLNESAEYK